jgi:hypothetical protein
MSQFLSYLVVTQVEETSNDYRGLWRLDADLIYESVLAQKTITVPKGFLTDFESCPRLPLVYLLFGDISHRAATVHDFLYRSKMVSREVADKVFLEAMAVAGTSWWRRYGIYLGVRIGGHWAYGCK